VINDDSSVVEQEGEVEEAGPISDALKKKPILTNTFPLNRDRSEVLMISFDTSKRTECTNNISIISPFKRKVIAVNKKLVE
jgi:phosphoheptose isomerase